jgi:hypothetical protein
MNREEWLAIRGNGGSLTKLYRARGVTRQLPKVRQGQGINGVKAQIKAAKRGETA